MNRWNHVCLVLNSREQGTLEDCSVMVLMKGVDVASSLVTINVHDIVSPGATDATTSISNSKNQSHINTVDLAMQRTILLFGLGASYGFENE